MAAKPKPGGRREGEKAGRPEQSPSRDTHNILDGTLNDLNNVIDPIRLHDKLGILCHVGVLYGINLAGAGVGGPARQYPRTCTHVHHYLVLEEIAVANNC